MSVIEDHETYQEVRISSALPGDFFALLKPRVMSLVVFTALVGLLLAPGSIDPVLGVISILCIAIGAGASGALNMWYDADIDAVMSRTAKRPIPSGAVTREEALGFGLVLSAFSVLTFGLAVNWFAAGLLAFTIFYYTVVYSMWLKRSTPQNIVIGGAAGAFPPMIGWAAVTGSIGIESIVLFAIIFVWTPPHFWALALFKFEDYKKAAIPMMPNVAGVASTKKQMFAYSLLLAPLGVAPWIWGFASIGYGIIASAFGLAFVWFTWKVLQMDEADQIMLPAKKLFRFSILYLFVLYGSLMIEAILPKVLSLVGTV